jgi:hypothetical protein
MIYSRNSYKIDRFNDSFRNDHRGSSQQNLSYVLIYSFGAPRAVSERKLHALHLSWLTSCLQQKRTDDERNTDDEKGTDDEKSTITGKIPVESMANGSHVVR